MEFPSARVPSYNSGTIENVSRVLVISFVRDREIYSPLELSGRQELQKAIESGGRVTQIEGPWWHYFSTDRITRERSAMSLLRLSRDRNGAVGAPAGVRRLRVRALDDAIGRRKAWLRL